MARKWMLKKYYAAIVLSTLIGTQLVGCTAFSEPQSLIQKEQSIDQEEKQTNEDYEGKYLEVYFDIKDLPEQVTREVFTQAMMKVSDFDDNVWQGEEELTYEEAVKIAVQAAQLEELALVYTDDKIEAKGITSKAIDAPYMTCALDTGMISVDTVASLDRKRILSKEDATHLLMAVANINGKGNHYLGYTNDEDIYGKVLNAFESAVLFHNEKLQSIGSQAVMSGLTTGYNLLNNNYSANFLPELTLRYGHSTLKHATQLIGLLNSEGIVAKVQLEPKTSIFQYLPEWGPVPESTPYYQVETINENLMLAKSLEYDLVFEFQTQQDKLTFNQLVETYAKKNDANQGEGLLAASWWQPLYTSSVPVEEGYKPIDNNIIVDGDYTLNLFCLPEDKEKVSQGLSAIDKTIEVTQVQLWCNDAFYRYLSGESHE